VAFSEIRCPECGSTSVSRVTGAYCCDFCGRKFQVIKKIQNELALSMSERQQIKYGKVNFDVDSATKLGNFSLDKNVSVTYYIKDVFKFHCFKQIKRGYTIVRAEPYGYVFANPTNGTIDDVSFAEGFYPTAQNLKNLMLAECIRIINDNAFENSPSFKCEEQELNVPSFFSIDTLKKEVFKWLLQNFAVRKNYHVQSGPRQVLLTFKKKNILEFSYSGCYAVPLFKLSYIYPNSSRILKREILGYSRQIIQDDFKCSKTRMFGGACKNFPNNLCSICANPICDDHQRQCEKCGTIICKDCAVSKGLITRHHFCPKC
jgi:hypothetical protein